MSIKSKSKQARDAMQHGIYRVINPLVRLMIRCGCTPNMVTTIGFLGQVAAAVIIVGVGYRAGLGQPLEYGLVTWAGGLIIFFSLFDMLDGQVARLGNMVSRFGAMYDSILDRYCEMTTLGGICFYLIQAGYLAGAIITFIALIGSLMVSYVRARAEGVGLECKIGFMQRPERVVVTSVALLATGITGLTVTPTADFDPNYILMAAMLIIAVFANLTAIARIMHCRRQLNAKQ